MNEDYMQATFKDIYKCLVTFSNQIGGIRITADELTLRLSDTLPKPWKQFLTYISLGTYFHHRCQGYVECLLVTNTYSPLSIEIWIHELVNPAAAHFMQAMQLMDEIKEIKSFQGSDQLTILEKQMTDFQKTAMVILDYTNHLDSMFAK